MTSFTAGLHYLLTLSIMYELGPLKSDLLTSSISGHGYSDKYPLVFLAPRVTEPGGNSARPADAGSGSFSPRARPRRLAMNLRRGHHDRMV